MIFSHAGGQLGVIGMALAIAALDGLSWARVRSIAREIAAANPTDDVVRTALELLGATDSKQRMLAVYLLGYTADQRPENLDVLREKAGPDPSWEVQEVLAQAFDQWCAAV